MAKCASCDVENGHAEYCRYDQFDDWSRGLFSMNGPWPDPNNSEDRMWIFAGDGLCMLMKPREKDGWTEVYPPQYRTLHQ